MIVCFFFVCYSFHFMCGLQFNIFFFLVCIFKKLSCSIHFACFFLVGSHGLSFSFFFFLLSAHSYISACVAVSFNFISFLFPHKTIKKNYCVQIFIMTIIIIVFLFTSPFIPALSVIVTCFIRQNKKKNVFHSLVLCMWLGQRTNAKKREPYPNEEKIMKKLSAWELQTRNMKQFKKI